MLKFIEHNSIEHVLFCNIGQELNQTEVSPPHTQIHKSTHSPTLFGFYFSTCVFSICLFVSFLLPYFVPVALSRKNTQQYLS